MSIGDGNVNLLAVVGGVTVIGGAGLAFVQNDIKKVLAYSTVSQLGYMVMGLGVGAWTAAVFHIFTHAFFKALLFLAAGSVLFRIASVDAYRITREKIAWITSYLQETLSGVRLVRAFGQEPRHRRRVDHHRYD